MNILGLGPVIGTIRRCSLAGVGMDFVEEVCHFGAGNETLLLTMWEPVVLESQLVSGQKTPGQYSFVWGLLWGKREKVATEGKQRGRERGGQ